MSPSAESMKARQRHQGRTRAPNAPRSETVYYAGRRAGKITWDGERGRASFESSAPELKPLERLAWLCPVACRNSVLDLAGELGL